MPYDISIIRRKLRSLQPKKRLFDMLIDSLKDPDVDPITLILQHIETLTNENHRLIDMIESIQKERNQELRRIEALEKRLGGRR